MSFFTNPSVAGIQLPFNQLAGPLKSLFQPEGKGNFVYPSDLTTNPAMCHAVQFNFCDWTTDFQQDTNSVINQVSEATEGAALQELNTSKAELKTAIDYVRTQVAEAGANITNKDLIAQKETAVEEASLKVFQLLTKAFTPGTYKPRTLKTISTVSLYMPDTLTADFESQYNTLSFTNTLGKGGFIASAAESLKGKVNFSGGVKQNYANILSDPAVKEFISSKIDSLGGKLGVQGDTKDLLNQALGQFVNPQMQLIYQGRDFRNFSMSFVFTPKSSAEAQTVKNIIDTFIFYSSPGVTGVGTNQPGRYLTPPQIVNVKMVFTGGSNGIAGAVINQFQSALNNVGLGFLGKSQSITNTVNSGKPAKVFNIKECVITNVRVDYAPNGWAAFEDGYPVQTTMTVDLRETQIFTKEDVQNSVVASNYNDFENQQALDSLVNQLQSKSSEAESIRQDLNKSLS